MAKKTVSNKKRVVKVDAYGEAHISSTFNNVIVTLTNSLGQVISWSSAGKMHPNQSGTRHTRANIRHLPTLFLAKLWRLSRDANKSIGGWAVFHSASSFKIAST